MSRAQPRSWTFGPPSASPLFSVVGFPLLPPGMCYFCVFAYLMPFTRISACWRPIRALGPSESPPSPRISMLGSLQQAGFWVWTEEGGHWSPAGRLCPPPRDGWFRWALVLGQERAPWQWLCHVQELSSGSKATAWEGSPVCPLIVLWVGWKQNIILISMSSTLRACLLQVLGPVCRQSLRRQAGAHSGSPLTWGEEVCESEEVWGEVLRYRWLKVGTEVRHSGYLLCKDTLCRDSSYNSHSLKVILRKGKDRWQDWGKSGEALTVPWPWVRSVLLQGSASSPATPHTPATPGYSQFPE